jgi:hypothetical protein
MPPQLAVILVLHILAAIVWAGATVTLSRREGPAPVSLFVSQMGSAALTFLSGGALWSLLHAGSTGPREWVLIAGIAAAASALLLQLVLRSSPARSNRLAIPFLALAAITMLANRAF